MSALFVDRHPVHAKVVLDHNLFMYVYMDLTYSNPETQRPKDHRDLLVQRVNDFNNSSDYLAGWHATAIANFISNFN